MAHLVLRFPSSDLTHHTQLYVTEALADQKTILSVRIGHDGTYSKWFLSCLETYLKEVRECSVVLIGAHGKANCSEIFIRDVHGKEQRISVEEIAEKLSEHSERIKKVKLFTCFSAEGEDCLAKKFASVAKVKTVGYRHLVYISKDPSSDLYLEFSKKDNRRFSRVAFVVDDKGLISRDYSKEKDLLLQYPRLFTARASQECRNDKEVALAAVRQDGAALQYADRSLKRDKDVAFAAIRQDGAALQYADISLKRDKEIVFAAIRQSESAFKYADDSLKKDPSFVFFLTKLRPRCLDYADQAIRGNFGFICSVVQQNGWALKYVGEMFKRDRRIVLFAVRQDGKALQFADDFFKRDLEIAFFAVRQNRRALEYVDERCRARVFRDVIRGSFVEPSPMRKRRRVYQPEAFAPRVLA